MSSTSCSFQYYSNKTSRIDIIHEWLFNPHIQSSYLNRPASWVVEDYTHRNDKVVNQ